MPAIRNAAHQTHAEDDYGTGIDLYDGFRCSESPTRLQLEAARAEFSLRKRAPARALSPSPSPPPRPRSSVSLKSADGSFTAPRRVHPKPASMRVPKASRPSSSTMPRKKKTRNAFIIFRSYILANNLLPHSITRHQNNVSCRASEIWKSMSEEEQRPFYRAAQIEKEHAQKQEDHGVAGVVPEDVEDDSVFFSDDGIKREPVDSFVKKACARRRTPSTPRHAHRRSAVSAVLAPQQSPTSPVTSTSYAASASQPCPRRNSSLRIPTERSLSPAMSIDASSVTSGSSGMRWTPSNDLQDSIPNRSTTSTPALTSGYSPASTRDLSLPPADLYDGSLVAHSTTNPCPTSAQAPRPVLYEEVFNPELFMTSACFIPDSFENAVYPKPFYPALAPEWSAGRRMASLSLSSAPDTIYPVDGALPHLASSAGPANYSSTMLGISTIQHDGPEMNAVNEAWKTLFSFLGPDFQF